MRYLGIHCCFLVGPCCLWRAVLRRLSKCRERKFRRQVTWIFLLSPWQTFGTLETDARGAFTCDSTEFVSEPAPSSFDIPQSTKWHQILINTQSQTTNHPRVVLWRYRCKPRCPWSLTPSSHNIRNNMYTKRG